MAGACGADALYRRAAWPRARAHLFSLARQIAGTATVALGRHGAVVVVT